jgi:anionic cell wall polymer biosynthesis LytR-Cps2A-Psr (LCP) family protein
MNETVKTLKRAIIIISKFLVVFSLLILLTAQVGLILGVDKILSTLGTSFNSNSNPLELLNLDNVKLDGQSEGRTNILIFGINEEDDDGQGSVDSNIVFSYFYDKKASTTISLARDLNVSQGTKVNSIYPNIEDSPTKDQEYKQEFSDLVGLQIHYVVRVKMKAVRDMVDTVGGVDVDVKQGFFDQLYPRSAYDSHREVCKDVKQTYPANHLEDDGTVSNWNSNPYTCSPPSFDKGTQVLDGKKALIYARSRKGICYEGKLPKNINGEIETAKVDELGCVENGDNARSLRQQVVIQALLDKLKGKLNLKTKSLDIGFTTNLFQVLGENLKTDLSFNQTLALAKIVGASDSASKIKKISIDASQIEKESKVDILKQVGSSDLLFLDNTYLSSDSKSPYYLKLKKIYQDPLSY